MGFFSRFGSALKEDVLPAAIAAFGAYFATGNPVFAAKVFATQIVLGGIQRSLEDQPDTSLGGAKDITTTSRDSTASRRLIYGKRRVGGTIVYIHSTDDDSQLHFIIALCEGPIEAIDEIYFNNEVAVQANGTVVSKYSGLVQVDKKLGTASQTASSLAVQETPDTGNGAWTTDHRLRGVAYIYVELSFDRDKFPQGVPNISAVVRGRNDIDDPRDSSTGYTTNNALVLKHYIENSKYGLNGTVNDSSVEAAADICDESVSLKSGGTENRYTSNGLVDSSDAPETILADMANSMAGWVTFTGGEWNIHAGTHPSLTETAEDSTTNDNDGTLVNGPTWVSDGPNENTRGALSFDGVDDNVTIPNPYGGAQTTATIEGWAKIDDTSANVFFGGGFGDTVYPRCGVNSSNQSVFLQANLDGSLVTALSPADGVTVGQWHHIAAVFDVNAAKTMILYVDAFEVASDSTAGTSFDGGASDFLLGEQAGLAAVQFFGREADWRSWSTARTQQQIQDNMNTRLNGDESGLVGYWRLDDGSPVMELTEDHMISEIDITTRLSRRERFNAVRGVYVSASNDYQPADFPAYTDSAAITEDNGETIWKDIQLPYTATASMSQRLARIDVERARREILVQGTFSLPALQLVAGDVVEITDDQMGWTNKEFEVVDIDPEFSLAPGVSLSLRETDSGVYSWNSDDESEVVQAPETDFPDPFTVSAPTNLTLSSGTNQLFVKKDGTVVSRIKATWDQSSGAFVDRYQVQYKKSADSDWTNAGDVDDDNRVAFAWEVEDDEDYDLRVRAVNQLGIRSSWTTSTNHTVVGKTEAPPNPDTFDVVVQADGTREFTFSLNSPPADLGGFEVRSVSGSSTTWSAMTTITPQGKLVFSPFETNQIDAGLHSFGVKSVDTSGNYSSGALFIEQDLPNPRLAGVLLQRKEKALGWPGTLNSMYKDTDDVLRAVAASTGQWGDLSSTTWADASGESWFSWTDRESPVSYETEEIDLGTDAIFTPRVTVSATGSTNIEMKTGTDAEGNVTGSYVSLDDVEGARYVQIRVTITGTTPELASMTTLIDGQTEITRREDIDTSTETASWFNSIAAGHFQISANDDTGAITQATITAIQGITTRHWWSLENKTSTVGGNPAAEFKVYDETDTLADVTIDVELKGPKKAS